MWNWKKYRWVLVLAFSSTWLSAWPSLATGQTILVVGDSLSAAYGLKEEEGWVALLASAEPKLKVVNASISGDTTAGGLARLPALLERHQPKVVIIELGGNDGLRGQPLNASADNLLAMTQMAQAKGARVLLLGMKIPPNYGAHYSQQFEAMYTQTAQKTKASLLPFFLEPISLKPHYFQLDRIHPTAAAQPVLLKHVLPELHKIIKTLK